MGFEGLFVLGGICGRVGGMRLDGELMFGRIEDPHPGPLPRGEGGR